jgi:cytochrome P450
MVTGHPEAKEIYRDPATFPMNEEASGTFSSCNAVSGPFVKFSVPVESTEDISDIIAAHRNELPFSDQLPTFDPPMHTEHRYLMMRLITPKRLKENEDFMWSFADGLIDPFLDSGSCEFVGQYAEPFTRIVVADLEGVPEEDHSLFHDHLSTGHENMDHKPLEFLYDTFTAYIEDRRRNPRNDILTGLATATFPDGSTPEVKDAALLAANLFVGGQETTVRLLTFALRTLAERPDLQKLLRDDRDKIPNFIEETLRLESPLRTQFRMTRVRTQISGLDIPAGASLMMIPGACNRDPRVFDRPGEFDVDRANARQHLAFGHGEHAQRARSRSTDCWTVPVTSPSRRARTARRALVSTSTCRRSSCAACSGSNSNSAPWASRIHDDVRSQRQAGHGDGRRWTVRCPTMERSIREGGAAGLRAGVRCRSHFRASQIESVISCLAERRRSRRSDATHERDDAQ